ncbi:MAG: biotin transporter BioY [Lachnospiraceae bacterium]|nr:biotin transporter BioY [Lachnospiraceae bacterium]
MYKKTKNSTHEMTYISLMTAILCILGPIAIPLGTIPISLTTFILYIMLYISKRKSCLLSYSLYLFLGTAGLPVFSGFSGGVVKLAGPTGGYLVGFIFLIFISGFFIRPDKNTLFAVIGMTIGALIAYVFGTIWFCIQMQCTIYYALTVCVFPFLIGDTIKIFLAVKIGPLLRKTLYKANLL